MTLTPEQAEKVAELAKPLAQWMAVNCHPHTTDIVNATSVVIVEGVMQTKLDTLIPD